MTDQQTQRSSCRFEAKAPRNGTPALRLELFHPVPALAGMTLEFELLSGTTLEQAKRLAESINERTIGIIVNAKGDSSPLP
jgi:hypothetical protein